MIVSIERSRAMVLFLHVGISDGVDATMLSEFDILAPKVIIINVLI